MRKTYKHIIGIDFDNTVINYDEIMFEMASASNFINGGAHKSKKSIRDNIQKQHDGEYKWQNLQAMIYGPEIGKAKTAEGIIPFLYKCTTNKIPVYIISHKTRHPTMNTAGINLRDTALNWMHVNGFFSSRAISRENVFFESTRQKKIGRIKKLKCTHFIDDLEEMFLETTFPTGTFKILYSPHAPFSKSPPFMPVRSWDEITRYFFNA